MSETLIRHFQPVSNENKPVQCFIFLNLSEGDVHPALFQDTNSHPAK